MAETSVKQEFLKAIERLPEDATLEDVAHLVKMHELLARARRSRAEGQTFTTDEMREHFGIAREG